MLAQELAYRGRTVVEVAYPESWKGNVTDEFGKRAEETTDFEPHTSYFKQGISQISDTPEVAETF